MMNHAPDVTTYPGIAVMPCRAHIPALYNAMEQAGAETGPELPAVLHENRQLITMRLEDWEALYTPWRQERELLQAVDDMAKEAYHFLTEMGGQG